MRLDDLPPNERAQAVRAMARGDLGGEQGNRPSRRERKPARNTSARIRGGRWTCQRCSSAFRYYLTAERHVDETHGGGRIEWEA